MPSVRPFRLAAPGGRALRGLLDLPERPFPPPWPTVVVCHGFKGFMEWGFFPPLAELLADRGFLVVRFDFSGAGVAPGEDLVSDPAAFRDDTYSRELEDLGAVLGALGEVTDGRCDPRRVALLGHSRGGAIALLAAAHPDHQGRVAALATWSAIASVDRWTDEEKERWRRDGELPMVNARTGQVLALGRGLLDDVERHGAALDLVAAAHRRTAPLAPGPRPRRRERPGDRGGAARRGSLGTLRAGPRRGGGAHLRRRPPLRPPDAPAHRRDERHPGLAPPSPGRRVGSGVPADPPRRPALRR